MTNLINKKQLRMFNGTLVAFESSLWEPKSLWIVAVTVLTDVCLDEFHIFLLEINCKSRLLVPKSSCSLTNFLPNFSIFKYNQHQNNLPELFRDLVSRDSAVPHCYIKHCFLNFNVPTGQVAKIQIYFQEVWGRISV